MTVTVYGNPAPQGSKRFMGLSKKGHGILVESCPRVKTWREAVKWAAIEAGERMTGPVRVSMTFTLPKPVSAPKRRVTYPDRKPDLSKLVRSTEDALTDVKTWEDDARVVECVAAKRYPSEGDQALDRPGAVIVIEAVVAK